MISPDLFLLEETTKQEVFTLANDIPTQQYSNFREYFDAFFKLHNIDRVLELGTSKGGLTYHLATKYSLPVLSVDITTDHVAKKVFDVAKIMEGNHYDPVLIDYLAINFIDKPGKLLILCDGVDKPHNFNTFAGLLREGDIIAVHDYFETKEEWENQNIWGWVECTKEDISDTIKEHSLEETDSYMRQIAWSFWKKTSK